MRYFLQKACHGAKLRNNISIQMGEILVNTRDVLSNRPSHRWNKPNIGALFATVGQFGIQQFFDFRKDPAVEKVNAPSSKALIDETLTKEKASQLPKLMCALDVPSSRSFHVGKGLALYLQGWAFCPGNAIRRLYVLDGTRQHEIKNHSWARPDVVHCFYPAQDPTGGSLFSEFTTILPIEEIAEPETRELRLLAELKSGDMIEQSLAAFRLQPGTNRRPVKVKWPATGPKIAICMAAYNPPQELLEQQIASIIGQDHKNWICIITDDSSNSSSRRDILDLVENDKRFIYVRNRERKGFYKNFEECLSLVPVGAEFVALADQDDRWRADKLTKLVQALPENKKLAFSDCRIVAADEVVSDTYWSHRKNEYTDFLSLFLGNSVSGAASLFRSDILDRILPFPQRLVDAYHDQWIALTAQVAGGISYTHEPLYDYHQHGANVVGQVVVPYAGVSHSIGFLLKGVGNKRALVEAGRALLHQARRDFVGTLEKAIFAETLRLRNPGMPGRLGKIVNRMSRLTTSLAEVILLRFSAALRRRSTLNVEGQMMNAALGVRARNLAYRLKKAKYLQYVRKIATGSDALPKAAASGGIPSVADTNASWIIHNIQPLTLRVSKREPKRVNILLATIDFKYIFGGYIGMFSLALRLRREGFLVRIVTLEHTELDMALARERIKGYPGVEQLFDEIEIEHRYDRDDELFVNPNDRFIATNGWAAHVAHHASRKLGQDRFMFMVQEYEPYFLPMNTIAALFQQSYRFPQFQLFSTPLLRDFFKLNKIGVFSQPGAKENHAVFRNAIQKFKPSIDDMRDRERRILFYARPEAHAARNMFELGIMALAELARSPGFDADKWKCYGMGSIGGASKIRLAKNVVMEMLPKTDLQTYTERLPHHDVGLSLMLTPHPSLVPLEMASAGMWTVTNTFENKTAKSLRDISTNLIAVEPTLEGVVAGLKDAISRVDQYDKRLQGSRFDWPTDWNDAFSQATMKKIVDFLSDAPILPVAIHSPRKGTHSIRAPAFKARRLAAGSARG
ncbi:glycosyltransferase [Mesorhizobium sp. M0924]|uniref:rhamnosyltransferase WsaF family glycosyltransferase n=1 Tax=unclassified Mesorhizobium TaxID=325217 RepID=UPI0033376A29